MHVSPDFRPETNLSNCPRTSRAVKPCFVAQRYLTAPCDLEYRGPISRVFKLSIHQRDLLATPGLIFAADCFAHCKYDVTHNYSANTLDT